MTQPQESTVTIGFMSRTVIVLFALVAVLPISAAAQEFEHSRRAGVLARQFDTDVERARFDAAAQIEEAEATFAAGVDDLIDTYLEGLEAIQQEETTAGRLDAAVEVRDVIAEITSKRDELTRFSEEEPQADGQASILEALDGTEWQFGSDIWAFAEGGLVINGSERPALLPYADGLLVLHNMNKVIYVEFNADLTAASRHMPRNVERGERTR